MEAKNKIVDLNFFRVVRFSLAQSMNRGNDFAARLEVEDYSSVLWKVHLRDKNLILIQVTIQVFQISICNTTIFVSITPFQLLELYL